MRTILLCLVSALLPACAMQPYKIEPAAVSESQYSSMNCSDLAAQLDHAQQSLEVLDKAQSKQARTDSIMIGVGLAVFWPVIFVPAFDHDHADEIARLKGERDAIINVEQRNCAR